MTVTVAPGSIVTLAVMWIVSCHDVLAVMCPDTSVTGPVSSPGSGVVIESTPHPIHDSAANRQETDAVASFMRAAYVNRGRARVHEVTGQPAP